MLKAEIDNLSCKYDHIISSSQYEEQQIINFIDYVIPSLAKRNINMKQKKINPDSLDFNFDKFTCLFPSCNHQLFSTKQKFIQHLNGKHRSSLPDGCRFLAPNDSSLNLNDLICIGCGKKYSRSDKYKYHLKTNVQCQNQVNNAEKTNRIFKEEQYEINENLDVTEIDLNEMNSANNYPKQNKNHRDILNNIMLNQNESDLQNRSEKLKRKITPSSSVELIATKRQAI